jgi:hypothetical protein
MPREAHFRSKFYSRGWGEEEEVREEDDNVMDDDKEGHHEYNQYNKLQLFKSE